MDTAASTPYVSRWSWGRSVKYLITICCLAAASTSRLLAQPSPQRPALHVATTTSAITVDGRLDEPAWALADSVMLTRVESREGAAPAFRTVVRVLVRPDAIVIGIRADDSSPAGIVAFARQRDAALGNEDHVKVVLDTYGNGRSG